MDLLIFAHRGEAQIFIKELKAKAQETDIYISETNIIYICREGIYDVMVNLGIILERYNIKNIINYGIAGSINSKIKLNTIYSIRTAYLEDPSKLQFQSFTLNHNNNYDCVTTASRVLNNEYAEKLQPIGDIVDREIWGIAKVASQFKVNLKSFKLMSDIAGDNTDCFDLKERALEFSESLYTHYTQIKNLNFVPKEKTVIPFECSQYQKNQLKSLIPKLDNNIYQNILKKINGIKKRDKDKANQLISELRQELYPFKYQILNHISHRTNVLSEAGFNIQFDEKLEKERLNLSLEINSQRNILNAIEALEEFNYEDFISIFRGKLDV